MFGAHLKPQVGSGDLSKLILVRVDQQPEEGADATSDNKREVQSNWSQL
jgi:hypothetical protein